MLWGGESCDEDEEYDDEILTLKDIVEDFDEDNLYPEFEAKIEELQTLDAIEYIIVNTNDDDDGMGGEYDWVKFDFVNNELKRGTDRKITEMWLFLRKSRKSL
ncbi:MAG: hypothetical protein HFE72_00890 [Emergencia sp.]|nr:hypothetical protein [Emergencia sp.]